MLPEKRLDQLVYGLSRTLADVVYLEITSVAEILGMELTERLCTPVSAVVSDISTKRKQISKRAGTGKFNRLELLEILRKVELEEEEIIIKRKVVNVASRSQEQSGTEGSS